MKESLTWKEWLGASAIMLVSYTAQTFYQPPPIIPAPNSATIPQIGTVFTAHRGYAVCPSLQLAQSMLDLMIKNDTSSVTAMMLSNGGVCMNPPGSVQWVVVDSSTEFVGFRLADTPNGGTMWAPIGIIGTAN